MGIFGGITVGVAVGLSSFEEGEVVETIGKRNVGGRFSGCLLTFFDSECLACGWISSIIFPQLQF